MVACVNHRRRCASRAGEMTGMDMNTADLLAHLTALHTRLDLLAKQAIEKGDAQHDRYYYGVLFGIEIARDDLAKIIDEAQQAQADNF
jgi:hypothetical protein